MKKKDEIEKLFERQLTNKHFVFSESDWDKMEQKLNANPDTSGFFVYTYIKGFILLLALSLAFLIGWFSNDMLKEKSSANLNEQAKMNFQDQDITPQTTLNEEQVKISEANKSELPHFKSSREGTALKDSGIKKETTNSKSRKFHANNQQKIASEKYVVNEIEGKPSSKNASVALRNSADNFTPSLLDGIKEKQIPPQLKLPENLIGKVSVLNYQSNKKGNEGSGFSIGLSYAPDFTSSGFMNEPQIALSFGVPVYYHFKNRWAIQSGFNYVKKKYGSEPQDYMPYEGYWEGNSYGIPDEINGNCGVIDIPLNIIHQWKTSAGISLLASAGISNYILLNEGYTYTYTGYYNKSYSWESSENSKVIAGILNASVGISWKINNKIIVHLEPYLKVPFKNVGFGNLRLFSAGTAFTIRHKL